ncbi:hypothetical protein [Actinoplanes sp. NPDC049265]|uniref:hypothetical protein n=1 Tax=Actinoplanes sp. NPDC049265 TaxID=3363902 RepID=UPI0037215C54
MLIDSLPGGVTLTRNQLGGHWVEWNGRLIGWLHASIGNHWNAYAYIPDSEYDGDELGRFSRVEALKKIAKTAGWKSSNKSE